MFKFARITRALAVSVSLGALLISSQVVTAQNVVGTAPATVSVSSPLDDQLYHKVWQKVARNAYDINTLNSWTEKEHEFDGRFSEQGMQEAYSTLLVAMLSSPYAALYDPDEMKSFNEKFDAPTTASVAVTFPKKWADHALFSNRVDEVPFETVQVDSKAAAAGLLAGDKLVAIDGHALHTIDFTKVQGALEGDPGTFVTLTVVRKGQTFSVRVEREVIVEHGAHFSKFGRYAGLFSITSFAPEATADDVSKGFDQAAASRVVVVDLRDNAGGALPNGIAVASMFVKEGVLMRIRSRVDSDLAHPRYVVDYYEVTATELLKKHFDETTGVTTIMARAPRTPYRLNHRPVVLLVNGKTASASEVVIGAIKDHAGTANGARSLTIIGENSFGKGIGQTVFDDLPGGYGMTLTTFRYFSPNGFWPGDGDSHRIGYKPSIKVIGSPQQLAMAQRFADKLALAR